ncbi:uncharacterized protein LOC126611875 [Malus sylvestris]|uniref:uncharacterized protein LOC126611875 n=1 Tax=Malus sylvestris TaxID=3752 RepID=UPI0021ACB272|nr:uncharacterized protein LOC126611875 [Malus sylvestris]
MDDNVALLKPVEDNEIWEAVKSIRALKSPGPDGIGAGFYQECWDIVKDSRLRPLLDCCISESQWAFVPGRSIHDNILTTHEIFFSFESKKGRVGSMGTKIDLEKAYGLLN